VAPAIAALAACLKIPLSLIYVLYALPSNSYYDIISGNNGAYNAVRGYDNCTGLGTINGTNFTSNVTKLLSNRVTSITLPATLSMSINESKILTPLINGSAIYPTVSWMSSNPSICSVSAGVLTAKQLGNVIITAITNNEFYSASTVVTIRAATIIPPQPQPQPQPPPPLPTSLTLYWNNKKTMRSMYVSRRNTLYFSTNVGNSNVMWSSSNKLATVINGVVTTNRFVGTVVISAKISVNVGTSIILIVL
jgi:uncharacterized protein YjdB